METIVSAYDEYLKPRIDKAVESVPEGQALDDIVPKRNRAGITGSMQDKYTRGWMFQFKYVVSLSAVHIL